MNLLSVLTEKSTDKVQKKIQTVLEFFYNEGIDIEEKICYTDPLYCLNYSVSVENIKNYPTDDFVDIFRFCISDALYKYIKDCEEPILIQYIIDTNYCCFDMKERMGIFRGCLDILKDENMDGFLSDNDIFGYKLDILQQLNNHLENNSEINVDGFILFRLKDYLLYLNEIVEKAVEDFLIEREYDEFIRLLKYFVDIQESKFDVVHVVFDGETKFNIYDQHNELLDNDYIVHVAMELLENNISQDDLLISELITIAPKQIIIHKPSVRECTEVIRILEKIFPEKIYFCDGCEWCNIWVNVNKE